ncbi:MAG: sialate O-acetylesterase [Rhodothermaceae bacterium]|nr:MAG: sialate O-acetylesterase [Rhodothermaceae bacterium]
MRFFCVIILVSGIGCLLPVPVSGQAAYVVQRPHWQHRVSLFRSLPNPEGEIVFLGDSITEGCEWQELTGLARVTNRGISGDTAWGILARLDEVTSGHPEKIFLLVGTNDLAHGESVADVYAKIVEIIDTIRRQTPGTEIYLQSVLPVYGREDGSRHNERILALNERLVGLVTRDGVTYVDVASAMRDASGQLMKELSSDGLHLNGRGYLRWYEVIRKYVDR